MKYDILVHLPSRGGEYSKAEYLIYSEGTAGYSGTTCTLSQDAGAEFGTDRWKCLGSYNLGPGARVQLGNIGDSSATGNVASHSTPWHSFPLPEPGTPVATATSL